MDRFEQSQGPSNARAWRVRWEHVDKSSAESGELTKFTDIDFDSLVLSKSLRPKKSIVAYVQALGTAALQAFLINNQYRLQQYLKRGSRSGRLHQPKLQLHYALIGHWSARVPRKCAQMGNNADTLLQLVISSRRKPRTS